jgi:two-component system cell cycle sensor histidine kinase/response regulator CckA
VEADTPQRPIRVLLVDDDEDDYLITRDLFAEIEGGGRYELQWIHQYESALDAIVAHQHDLYLIDYRLGAQTGLDLLQAGRRSGNNAPMILLTGLGEHQVDVQAMRAGAADFLVKDQINATSLERALRYALERKRAEEQIQKLAAFARLNPNPVFELAANGTLTYCNDAAQAMACALGEGSPEALLPAETAAIATQCLATGHNKLQLQTTVGNHTLSWSFFPVPASRTVHCCATDMTELLSLEAQLRHAQKMEAIGQLAAGVAHDFNNLLTIIQGHTSLLQANRSAEACAGKSLAKISQAADRASNLVKRLLTLSRKQVLQPQLLDLNEVVGNVSKMLHRVLDEHILLLARQTPGLPAVYADSGMIEQILMNLAVNARDAMPRGGRLTIGTEAVTLTETQARQHPQAKTKSFVCLSVADTGCGMDPAVLNRIFDPFFTTKEPGKGTGLGLTMVYSIVQQHNGWIDVQSEPGRGTTLRIFFPATAHSPQRVLPPTAPVEAARGAETILVVEDETALRDLVVGILSQHGYQVLAAESGVQALGVWAQHKHGIDLVLTDMVMPGGINGRELAERLRQEKPTVKVIYTSGYSPGIAGKDLRLMEGFNFLPKPYRPTKLTALVRECLDLPAEEVTLGTPGCQSNQVGHCAIVTQ